MSARWPGITIILIDLLIKVLTNTELALEIDMLDKRFYEYTVLSLLRTYMHPQVKIQLIRHCMSSNRLNTAHP